MSESTCCSRSVSWTPAGLSGSSETLSSRFPSSSGAMTRLPLTVSDAARVRDLIDLRHQLQRRRETPAVDRVGVEDEELHEVAEPEGQGDTTSRPIVRKDRAADLQHQRPDQLPAPGRGGAADAA